jgi:hypothetical protein
MNRRTFLATAATVAAASTAAAASGGHPMRATPLHACFSGPQFYDDHERREVVEVLDKRQPFRWYGPGDQPPRKVATFERELAARMRVRFALALTSGTAAR